MGDNDNCKMADSPDVFEKHRDLLREGYETHGSFHDYMKKN